MLYGCGKDPAVLPQVLEHTQWLCQGCSTLSSEASTSYSDWQTDGGLQTFVWPMWGIKASSVLFGFLRSPHLPEDLEVIVSLPRMDGDSFVVGTVMVGVFWVSW